MIVHKDEKAATFRRLVLSLRCPFSIYPLLLLVHSESLFLQFTLPLENRHSGQCSLFSSLYSYWFARNPGFVSVLTSFIYMYYFPMFDLVVYPEDRRSYIPTWLHGVTPRIIPFVVITSRATIFKYVTIVYFRILPFSISFNIFHLYFISALNVKRS
jgi:hypothetical protein